jgi:hypothetical protein
MAARRIRHAHGVQPTDHGLSPIDAVGAARRRRCNANQEPVDTSPYHGTDHEQAIAGLADANTPSGCGRERADRTNLIYVGR